MCRCSATVFSLPALKLPQCYRPLLCSPCPHCSGAGFYVPCLVLCLGQCPRAYLPCLYPLCIFIYVFSFLCSCVVLLCLVRSYLLWTVSLLIVLSHALYNIQLPIPFCYFSFPGLAFCLRGSSLCWPRLPVFWSDGPGALLLPAGQLSRCPSWVSACLFDRPSSLLPFSPPFFPSLWALPEGVSLFFSSNFSVLNLRTLFFSSFNPLGPVLFPPDARVFPRSAHVFPSPFFSTRSFLFPACSGFFARPFLCSGFFSRPVRFPMAFSRVSRPSLRLPCGASGSSDRSFAPAARPRGFASHRPFLFPPLTSSEVSPGAASSSRLTFGFLSTG